MEKGKLGKINFWGRFLSALLSALRFYRQTAGQIRLTGPGPRPSKHSRWGKGGLGERDQPVGLYNSALAYCQFIVLLSDGNFDKLGRKARGRCLSTMAPAETRIPQVGRGEALFGAFFSKNTTGQP